ncbi:putative CocE/NonD family hydrolase [Micromonospora luteifusca]|uniref:CocE/NonD family hydrolase n=1 Tax=Micromonospora luteifusca TaxID=709860 RepID=A0ABS2M0R1_9ACTN|nr:CocE/NonD family hydrolase [Micromonospora luteifusca]MBM7494050.1 putative CocE/NonD family hydrolase [Micromonospora luteifusca]
MVPPIAAAGALAIITSLTTGGLPAVAHAAPASASADAPITHEENPRVPEGAAWTQTYFPSSDGSGVELHADVLRPAHLPADAKTPVILSVGPYFSHAGETSPAGWDRVGPSARFQDFIDGAGLMERGYTVVMVDLRGFGGSTGCLDFLGPGEQADIKAAVEWAASRPWSTGKVGMYGKSYDANTGLAANVLKLKPLRAIVAQEPTWNRYNYLFSNGVPRSNATSSPRSYYSIATMPPLADDSDRYKANAEYEKTHPECESDNRTNTQNPDPKSSFWRARDFASRAAGSSTPLFVTSGFIEDNTKPEDMQKYLANHHGPERGWLGPWEHVRGNETNGDGQLKMGRAGWFDEVMRFYDQNLRGIAPSVTDPAFSIEDSLGHWRAQPTWPVIDNSYNVRLSPGQYVDNGGNAQTAALPKTTPPAAGWDIEYAPEAGSQTADQTSALSADGPSNSFWTFSTPASGQVRITGTPEITLKTREQGNVWVRLWDVAPDGKATMFNENVAVLDGRSTSFALKATDWTFERGHQLGVQIGTITSRGWRAVPSGQMITVTDARLALEVQDPRFDSATQGDRSPYLDRYVAANTMTLDNVGAPTFPLRVSKKG